MASSLRNSPQHAHLCVELVLDVYEEECASVQALLQEMAPHVKVLRT